ncbi:unnamed protein product [Urochloa humidicola]
MEDASPQRKRSSPWQHAPMDILGVVLHRANSLPDSARAAAVCRAWRRAVAHQHPPLPPQLPWLLLLPDLKLCSLSSDGATAVAHRLPRPDGAVPACVGSTHDGRVILLKDQSCFLLNPLSGVTNPLPDLCLSGTRKWLALPEFGNPAIHLSPDLHKPSPPRKVVMSGSPDSGSATCSILAGISDDHDNEHHGTLFLRRPGAATWSVTAVHPLWAQQSDIAFHNGKLYLFKKDIYPYLLVLDIGEDDDDDAALKVTLAKPLMAPRSVSRSGMEPPVDGGAFWFDFYLMESRGRLMLVRREFSFVERRTRSVAVFELDESTSRPEWATTESLGGEIIFLSATSAVSVPSSRHPGARGDRIYFSQEVYVDGCRNRKDCPHKHCEVFDMRTRTAEAVCMGTTAPGHGTTWFIPSPQTHASAN